MGEQIYWNDFPVSSQKEKDQIDQFCQDCCERYGLAAFTIASNMINYFTSGYTFSQIKDMEESRKTIKIQPNEL